MRAADLIARLQALPGDAEVEIVLGQLRVCSAARHIVIDIDPPPPKPGRLPRPTPPPLPPGTTQV